MKGRKVKIQMFFNAGSKDMLKLPSGKIVEILEVLPEDGTDLYFATMDKRLIYFTATCITHFVK